MSQTRQFLRKATSVFLMLVFLFMLRGHIKVSAAVYAEDKIPQTEDVFTEKMDISESDTPDSDELFEEFMLKTAKEELRGNNSTRNMLKSKRNNNLSDNSRVVYDELKKKIIKIANGSSDNTEIAIPIAGLFDENTKYTANDLGLNSFFDEEGNISKETLEAILKEADVDPDFIVKNLLSEIPYEMYWFDKTSFQFGLHNIYKDENSTHILPGYTSVNDPDGLSVVFYLMVSEDYRANENFLTTDSERITHAKAAAENAVEVVKSYSSNSDIEKLTDYKNWICKEVVYNQAAVDNDDPYGDPWQLIYVFDNDPNTNVVCEGYSKAFKYLCDLTSFNDSSISCNLVTGDMDGGTGADADGHMWNLVSIGGKNYLVDVTNCDSGSIGAPNKLFMVGTANDTENAEKYTFRIDDNNQITYIYDEDTISMFDAAERLLATSNYVSGEGGGNNENGGDTGVDSGKDPENPKPNTGEEPEPIDLAKADVNVSLKGSNVYTGSQIKPESVLILDGKKLELGTDYVVSYGTNINAGSDTGLIVVKGKEENGYTGTINITFNITPKNITPTAGLSKTLYTWNNRVQTPGVTVKDGNKVLKTNADYTLSYAGGRKNVGRYAVTVRMKGNYSGSKTVYFEIGPKATKLSKPAAAKKALTVKWAVQKSRMPKKQINGYQVQVSTRKDFRKAVKTKNINGFKKKSVKMSGLKARTKYYVRIRTYMKSGGRTVYSSWSGVKSAKTK